MIEEKKLPKKLMRNYILFDVTQSMNASVEKEKGLLPAEEEKAKLGCVIMVGENVTTISEGDEVVIPQMASIQPVLFRIGDAAYAAFREADVVAVI